MNILKIIFMVWEYTTLFTNICEISIKLQKYEYSLNKLDFIREPKQKHITW